MLSASLRDGFNEPRQSSPSGVHNSVQIARSVPILMVANQNAVEVQLVEPGAELHPVSQRLLRWRIEYGANPKAGKLRCANPFQGRAKSARAPQAPVVLRFRAQKAHGQIEAWLRLKLVNAGAQSNAIRLQEQKVSALQDQ